MNKKKINFRRIIEFIKPEWVFMTISLVNGLLYVIFNSISIWLTASLVNNVLIDFDQLVLDQENLLKNHDPSINERLKIMVNDFILRETNIETLKSSLYHNYNDFYNEEYLFILKKLNDVIRPAEDCYPFKKSCIWTSANTILSFFHRRKSGDLSSIVPMMSTN